MTARIISADARAIFRRFRALPRSDQIATEFALVGIMCWARRRPNGKALDYGYGLGTVSEALRAVDPHRPVVAVERQVAFSEHDGLFQCSAEIVDEDPEAGEDLVSTAFARTLRPAIQDNGPCAFVVIDDAADTYDLGTLAMKGLAPRAAVLFEGNRSCERGALLAMLAHVHRPHCTAEWKPADRAKGYHVVLCDPAWWERLWFAAVRLREGVLDGIARLRGVRPGFRRRDHDDAV